MAIPAALRFKRSPQLVGLFGMSMRRLAAHVRSGGTKNAVWKLDRFAPARQELRYMHGNLEQRSARPNRVLIVDDSDDATWALASLLQSYGHDVHVAHTGRRAIDLAERVHPAVIFLDLAMPEMDGFETALRIRRRRWGQEILLCALTAFDTPEFRERSGEVGINRYLAKPAEWHDLLAVATATSGRSSTATHRPAAQLPPEVGFAY